MDIQIILERLTLIDNKLRLVEVRGDSVEHLLVSRVALKELIEALLKEKSEAEEIKEGVK